MTYSLPFRLKVPGKDEFRGLHAVSTSFRFHGFLHLEGDTLAIEWSGVARVQDVGGLTIRDDRLALPDERISVPVRQLHRVTLSGGWWRPRLTLEARELGALAVVPSEEHGMVSFWYARGDRTVALALAAALGEAIAATSPRAVPSPAWPASDGSASTPPGGRTNP